MSKQNSTSPHRVPPYRRPLVIVSFLLLLAVATIITILVFKNLRPASSPEANAPTPPSVSRPADNDHSSSSDTPTDSPDNRPAQYEGEDPNLRHDLTGRISYKNIDYGSNQLIISVSIDQYLVDGGHCQLQLLNGDAVLASADLDATPDISTSVCGPFNIPITSIPQGSYQIRINITSGDRRGIITDQIDV